MTLIPALAKALSSAVFVIAAYVLMVLIFASTNSGISSLNE